MLKKHKLLFSTLKTVVYHFFPKIYDEQKVQKQEQHLFKI